jgi:hypothetical protein
MKTPIGNENCAYLEWVAAQSHLETFYQPPYNSYFCLTCGSTNGMEMWTISSIASILSTKPRHTLPGIFYQIPNLKNIICAPCPKCNPRSMIPSQYEIITDLPAWLNGENQPMNTTDAIPELENLFSAIGELMRLNLLRGQRTITLPNYDSLANQLHENIYDAIHQLTTIDTEIVVAADVAATISNQDHRLHEAAQRWAKELKEGPQ